VDRLRLRVKERVLAPGGLLRRDPLQARGLGPRGVTDADAVGVGRQGDAQRAAEHGVARVDAERDDLPGALPHGRLDSGDVEVARIEHQFHRVLG
jgi:hypothetical protein